MPAPESTPDEFCQVLLCLSPTERHERLKSLEANELFCAVVPLLPPHIRDEFPWLGKRDYVQSILKRPVADGDLEKAIRRESKDLGPTCLESLVDKQAIDDEIWRFQAIPGDKGFGLVRTSYVLDYTVTEVTSETVG